MMLNQKKEIKMIIFLIRKVKIKLFQKKCINKSKNNNNDFILFVISKISF